MKITHLNPATMHSNPAYSQGTVVESGARMVYVGEQNSVDREGNVVGDTLGEQTEQALRNVLAVLNEAGATQENVAKLTIFVVDGNDIREGFDASRKVWGDHATALTVVVVPALGRPQFLVGIEAVAAI